MKYSAINTWNWVISSLLNMFLALCKQVELKTVFYRMLGGDDLGISTENKMDACIYYCYYYNSKQNGGII